MKKMTLVLLSIVALSTFMLALNPPENIPIYRFETPTGWVEETNSKLADATATNEWDSGGYVTLSSPYQTSRIDWELDISQWIYVDIKYLKFNMHVNMPGDYTIGDLDITVKTNGGINVYFSTGGDLHDGSGHIIPTWLGYLKNSNQVLLPSLGGFNTSFAWNRIGDLPGENNFITILKPCGTIVPGEMGEETYKIWFGFRVANNTCKGNYSTYVDVYVQSDP